MPGLRQTLAVWRLSRHVAQHQYDLDRCPCCASPDLEFLFDANDLTTRLFVDRRLKRGRYSLCRHCGTVFSARRPRPEVGAAYYGLFPELENKDHQTYPPPSRNSKGKVATATEIIRLLDERALLAPDVAILHIRCDAGALLARLRDRLPDATLHGLDYFDANLRYVREQGFADVAWQNPASIELPFDTRYDVILANHLFTHALDPRADMAGLRAALKPGGSILIYNEVDHQLLLDPASELYTRLDVINYHKQLFVKETFESFLRNAGFAFAPLGARRFTFGYFATPVEDLAPAPAVSAAFIDRQRRLIGDWQRAATRYRYVLAAAQSLKGWRNRRARSLRQKRARA
jgi:SAM-dependent methyltransferase